MTELLKHAVAAVRGLQVERQDEIAQLMLTFANADSSPVELTPEEDAALDRSEAAAARGEFATDAQVAAIWAKHGLRGFASRHQRRLNSIRF